MTAVSVVQKRPVVLPITQTRIILRVVPGIAAAQASAAVAVESAESAASSLAAAQAIEASIDPVALKDRANHTGVQAISTVTGLQTALDLKAPLASPALTGNPTAPTQSPGNNSTRLATTAYADAAAAAANVADGDKGDITVSASGVTWTIDPAAITYAKFQNLDALSVFARSANSSGVGASVAAANDGEVLRRSGASLGFGTVATAGIADDAITYAKLQNVSATSRVLGRKTSGAGNAEELTLSEVLDFVGSAADGDILYRSGGAWTRLAKGTAGQRLRMNSGATAPEWAPLMQFYVHKNGTNQTAILTNTDTLVTWATEALDLGGYFDLGNNRVTPPAGAFVMMGILQFSAGVVDQSTYQMRVYKNGVFFAAPATTIASAATFATAEFTFFDVANGTDYYEVYGRGTGAGDKTISGLAVATYWQGFSL